MKFIIAILCALAMPAWAQTITPNSKCGEAATGYKADGSREVVTDQIAWARVGPDGVWMRCEVETAKPAPQQCPAEPALKTWTVGDNVCAASAPERMLADGETVYWQTWPGKKMRGQLIERCDAGVRRVTGKNCVPATLCDTVYRFDRDQVTYVYQGAVTPVPVGSSVEAESADGKRWPLTCDGGEWSAPLDLPTPPAAPASATPPRVLFCGPQTVRSKLAPSLALTYSGPRVLPGAEVSAYSIAGAAVRVVCRDNATLVPLWDLK